MAKSSRSLRFGSIDDMPPGMQVLARRAEEEDMNRQRAEMVCIVDTHPANFVHVVDLAILHRDVLEQFTGVKEKPLQASPHCVGHAKPMRRNKYGAVPTYRDGIRFDSKREARYYDELKVRQAAGEIRYFLRQVPLHLPGGTKLVVDFQIVEADGRIRFVDAKGRQTEAFKVKKREVEHHYGVEIELV